MVRAGGTRGFLLHQPPNWSIVDISIVYFGADVKIVGLPDC